MPFDKVRNLTPHASRVNGIVVSGDDSVAFYVPLLEYPQVDLQPGKQINRKQRAPVVRIR
jgi:hypothetical protein